MNNTFELKQEIISEVAKAVQLQVADLKHVAVTLNVDKQAAFGDMSCNAAMVLAKKLKKNPRELAQTIIDALTQGSNPLLVQALEKVEIAGPGFLNVFLKKDFWQQTMVQLLEHNQAFFQSGQEASKRKYFLEFVSANPTGPLHLGAGRNGIIGDVLANVLKFLGNSVHKEYYINDAGLQMKKLGQSLKARCLQQIGIDEQVPEGGYVGDYLIDIAKTCVQEFDHDVVSKDDSFFSEYAKKHLIQLIKADLKDYGIEFDQFFSEKKLHDDGTVKKSLEILKEKKLAYEKDGALWFKATDFGDDKDRVLQKSDGEMTYIAGDIAYHKYKFDSGCDKIINIFGQDHHGYVKRLKSTMQAMGYPGEDDLEVILYQLVSIKHGDVAVKMSKRAGTFTTLRDVIDTVGTDVARFFYLNRKAEAHLEIDLSIALKKTQENPVFYIQYAYVRVMSLFEKVQAIPALKEFVDKLNDKTDYQALLNELSPLITEAEIEILKKIVSLNDILHTVAYSYQTHLLAYYAWELANKYHNYYSNNRIIDESNIEQSKMRLLISFMIQRTIKTTLDLLGLSAPERM